MCTENSASDAIIDEMENLREMFKNCRAYFPHVGEANLGQDVLPTAPYYANSGYRLVVLLDHPLESRDIDRINALGRWENQNFVIRLYALLEARQIVSAQVKINFSLQGSREVDLIRRLRRELAHSSGRFNADDPDHRRLRDTLVEHLELDGTPDSFPLAIDTVLDPLFEGCVHYVHAKLSSTGEENTDA